MATEADGPVTISISTGEGLDRTLKIEKPVDIIDKHPELHTEKQLADDENARVEYTMEAASKNNSFEISEGEIFSDPLLEIYQLEQSNQAGMELPKKEVHPHNGSEFEECNEEFAEDIENHDTVIGAGHISEIMKNGDAKLDVEEVEESANETTLDQHVQTISKQEDSIKEDVQCLEKEAEIAEADTKGAEKEEGNAESYHKEASDLIQETTFQEYEASVSTHDATDRSFKKDVDLETEVTPTDEVASHQPLQIYEPKEELQAFPGAMSEDAKTESAFENAEVITCTEETRAVQNTPEYLEKEKATSVDCPKEIDTITEEVSEATSIEQETVEYALPDIQTAENQPQESIVTKSRDFEAYVEAALQDEKSSEEQAIQETSSSLVEEETTEQITREEEVHETNIKEEVKCEEPIEVADATKETGDEAIEQRAEANKDINVPLPVEEAYAAESPKECVEDNTFLSEVSEVTTKEVVQEDHSTESGYGLASEEVNQAPALEEAAAETKEHVSNTPEQAGLETTLIDEAIVETEDHAQKEESYSSETMKKDIQTAKDEGNADAGIAPAESLATIAPDQPSVHIENIELQTEENVSARDQFEEQTSAAAYEGEKGFVESQPENDEQVTDTDIASEETESKYIDVQEKIDLSSDEKLQEQIPLVEDRGEACLKEDEGDTCTKEADEEIMKQVKSTDSAPEEKNTILTDERALDNEEAELKLEEEGDTDLKEAGEDNKESVSVADSSPHAEAEPESCSAYPQEENKDEVTYTDTTPEDESLQEQVKVVADEAEEDNKESIDNSPEIELHSEENVHSTDNLEKQILTPGGDAEHCLTEAESEYKEQATITDTTSEVDSAPTILTEQIVLESEKTELAAEENVVSTDYLEKETPTTADEGEDISTIAKSESEEHVNVTDITQDKGISTILTSERSLETEEANVLPKISDNSNETSEEISAASELADACLKKVDENENKEHAEEKSLETIVTEETSQDIEYTDARENFNSEEISEKQIPAAVYEAETDLKEEEVENEKHVEAAEEKGMSTILVDETPECIEVTDVQAEEINSEEALEEQSPITLDESVADFDEAEADIKEQVETTDIVPEQKDVGTILSDETHERALALEEVHAQDEENLTSNENVESQISATISEGEVEYKEEIKCTEVAATERDIETILGDEAVVEIQGVDVKADEKPEEAYRAEESARVPDDHIQEYIPEDAAEKTKVDDYDAVKSENEILDNSQTIVNETCETKDVEKSEEILPLKYEGQQEECSSPAPTESLKDEIINENTSAEVVPSNDAEDSREVSQTEAGITNLSEVKPEESTPSPSTENVEEANCTKEETQESVNISSREVETTTEALPEIQTVEEKIIEKSDEVLPMKPDGDQQEECGSPTPTEALNDENITEDTSAEVVQSNDAVDSLEVPQKYETEAVITNSPDVEPEETTPEPSSDNVEVICAKEETQESLRTSTREVETTTTEELSEIQTVEEEEQKAEGHVEGTDSIAEAKSETLEHETIPEENSNIFSSEKEIEKEIPEEYSSTVGSFDTDAKCDELSFTESTTEEQAESTQIAPEVIDACDTSLQGEALVEAATPILEVQDEIDNSEYVTEMNNKICEEVQDKPVIIDRDFNDDQIIDETLTNLNTEPIEEHKTAEDYQGDEEETEQFNREGGIAENVNEGNAKDISTECVSDDTEEKVKDVEKSEEVLPVKYGGQQEECSSPAPTEALKDESISEETSAEVVPSNDAEDSLEVLQKYETESVITNLPNVEPKETTPGPSNDDVEEVICTKEETQESLSISTREVETTTAEALPDIRTFEEEEEVNMHNKSEGPAEGIASIEEAKAETLEHETIPEEENVNSFSSENEIGKEIQEEYSSTVRSFDTDVKCDEVSLTESTTEDKEQVDSTHTAPEEKHTEGIDICKTEPGVETLVEEGTTISEVQDETDNSEDATETNNKICEEVPEEPVIIERDFSEDQITDGIVANLNAEPVEEHEIVKDYQGEEKEIEKPKVDGSGAENINEYNANDVSTERVSEVTDEKVKECIDEAVEPKEEITEDNAETLTPELSNEDTIQNSQNSEHESIELKEEHASGLSTENKEDALKSEEEILKEPETEETVSTLPVVHLLLQKHEPDEYEQPKTRDELPEETKSEPSNDNAEELTCKNEEAQESLDKEKDIKESDTSTEEACIVGEIEENTTHELGEETAEGSLSEEEKNEVLEDCKEVTEAKEEESTDVKNTEELIGDATIEATPQVQTHEELAEPALTVEDETEKSYDHTEQNDKIRKEVLDEQKITDRDFHEERTVEGNVTSCVQESVEEENVQDDESDEKDRSSENPIEVNADEVSTRVPQVTVDECTEEAVASKEEVLEESQKVDDYNGAEVLPEADTEVTSPVEEPSEVTERTELGEDEAEVSAAQTTDGVTSREVEVSNITSEELKPDAHKAETVERCEVVPESDTKGIDEVAEVEFTADQAFSNKGVSKEPSTLVNEEEEIVASEHEQTKEVEMPTEEETGDILDTKSEEVICLPEEPSDLEVSELAPEKLDVAETEVEEKLEEEETKQVSAISPEVDSEIHDELVNEETDALLPEEKELEASEYDHEPKTVEENIEEEKPKEVEIPADEDKQESSSTILTETCLHTEDPSRTEPALHTPDACETVTESDYQSTVLAPEDEIIADQTVCEEIIETPLSQERELEASEFSLDKLQAVDEIKEAPEVYPQLIEVVSSDETYGEGIIKEQIQSPSSILLPEEKELETSEPEHETTTQQNSTEQECTKEAEVSANEETRAPFETSQVEKEEPSEKLDAGDAEDSNGTYETVSTRDFPSIVAEPEEDITVDETISKEVTDLPLEMPSHASLNKEKEAEAEIIADQLEVTSSALPSDEKELKTSEHEHERKIDEKKLEDENLKEVKEPADEASEYVFVARSVEETCLQKEEPSALEVSEANETEEVKETFEKDISKEDDQTVSDIVTDTPLPDENEEVKADEAELAPENLDIEASKDVKEDSEVTSKSDLPSIDAVVNDEIVTDQALPERITTEPLQVQSSTLLSEEEEVKQTDAHEHGIATLEENPVEEYAKETEVVADEDKKYVVEPSSEETMHSQEEESRELKVSELSPECEEKMTATPESTVVASKDDVVAEKLLPQHDEQLLVSPALVYTEGEESTLHKEELEDSKYQVETEAETTKVSFEPVPEVSSQSVRELGTDEIDDQIPSSTVIYEEKRCDNTSIISNAGEESMNLVETPNDESIKDPDSAEETSIPNEVKNIDVATPDSRVEDSYQTPTETNQTTTIQVSNKEVIDEKETAEVSDFSSIGEENVRESQQENEPKDEKYPQEKSDTFTAPTEYHHEVPEVDATGSSEDYIPHEKQKLTCESSTAQVTYPVEKESSLDISRGVLDVEEANGSYGTTQDKKQLDEESHAAEIPSSKDEVLDCVHDPELEDNKPSDDTFVASESKQEKFSESGTAEVDSTSAQVSLSEKLMEEKRDETVLHDHEDEEDEDEEKDDTEHKQASHSSDEPVIVEASRDSEVRVSPKKSHNILSGMGKSVKNSISKVKKAIIGKSSNSKTQPEK